MMTVHKAQLASEGHIELTLIRMSFPISLGHSYQSDFIMLHFERFIGEFTSVVGVASGLETMCFLNISELDVHAFDASRNFSAGITDILLSTLWFETLAQLLEVLASLWADVFEELDHDS